MATDLTADRLRDALQYDPQTGVFVWKLSAGKVCKGAVAGAVNSRGYSQIGVCGRIYQAHRLAWLWVHGRWPNGEIDHTNGIRTDNRLVNLREATRSENLANSRRRKDSVSGLKGVGWFKPASKWRARIAKDGRVHHLGYFDSAEAAHAAYKAAADGLHGEFARAA